MPRWLELISIIGFASLITACPKPKVEGVIIAPDSATVAIGENVSASARVDPAGVGQDVEWASDAPSITSVSSAGVVTGESIGTTTISATSVAKPTHSASATVTVGALVGEFEVGAGFGTLRAWSGSSRRSWSRDRTANQLSSWSRSSTDW